MTDKEYEEQKARLLSLRERWEEPLFQNSYDIAHTFLRIPSDECTDGSAITSTRWEYLHASVKWNMPEVAEMEDDELERCFVHEYMHVFVNEIVDSDCKGGKSSGHEERVCTALANAFVRVYQNVHENQAA